MTTIGDRIKYKRKELGLTQAELGRMLGVTDRAVSKWEQGEGNPDMSLITKLSTVLNVSLDYLITGNEPEEKIVIKSPKDILIETDDPKYLSDISVNDITIKELYSHKLANTFGYLVDNNLIGRYVPSHGRYNRYDDYVREIIYLLLISNRLDKIRVFSFNDIGYADENELSEDFFNAFATSDLVSDNTRDYVLSIHKRPLINLNQSSNTGNWRMLYPRLLNKFVEAEKWDWVEKMIGIFEEIKECHIPNNTLDGLLKKKKYDLLNRANEVNKARGGYVISDKAITHSRIDDTKDISDKEKDIKKATYKHIINPAIVKSWNDLELIRKTIDENYYHYYEMMYDWLRQKRYKDIFEFLVDNKCEEVATGLLVDEESNYQEFLNACLNVFCAAPGTSAYRDHYQLLSNQNDIGYYVGPNQLKHAEFQKRLEEILRSAPRRLTEGLFSLERNVLVDYIKELKENIYVSAKERIEAEKKRKEEQIAREREAKGLTKEYFEELLNRNSTESIELFKLKLCKLLDAIFMYDYHYEGQDFSERMNAHFKALEQAAPKDRERDDGWGYRVFDQGYHDSVVAPEAERIKHLRNLFYRLRSLRNNILHPDKVDVEELTDSEMRECLEYVYSIEKKTEA